MSNPTKQPFEPLIKRPTTNGSLNDKSVKIKGTNEFGRTKKNETINNTHQTVIQQNSNTKSNIVDSRLLPSKTAKVSPAVLLKLNTLKPFIKDLEDMDKASINNIIDMLLESYVNTKLNVRQSEGYKGMYKHLFEMLDVNKHK